MSDVDAAVRALDGGECVVYPTETVYGLGVDALDAEAVERVFAAKGRDRSKPVSLAAASVDDALAYTDPSERSVAFMRAFLPGPVTVVVERRPDVPDVLTAGSDRVGVRVPDHDVAWSLAERAGPITATSANVSGRPSATRLADVDEEIRGRAAVALDGGETAGTASTVVDVERGELLRAGARADDVRAWLADG